VLNIVFRKNLVAAKIKDAAKESYDNPTGPSRGSLPSRGPAPLPLRRPSRRALLKSFQKSPSIHH
jgi:hypothetical protein